MKRKDKNSSPSDFTSDFRAESRKDFDAAIERMLRAISETGHDNLASFLEISQDAIYKARKGDKIPPAWFLAVGKTTNISIDWLVTGEGPMRRGAPDIAQQEAQNCDKNSQHTPREMDIDSARELGFTLVPRVTARLCAGGGSLETESDVVGYYAFKTSFLKRKGLPRRMVLMGVSGDSMEPSLFDGDTVLIDESQNKVITGGLFAVGIESEVFVKNLDRIPGKLVLRSQNKQYAPIEIDMDGDLASSVRIIGRVVWSCREYVR